VEGAALSFLYDEDDAGRMVQEKVDSHDWWIIVGTSSEASGELMGEVEARYYEDEANADFEILIGPPVGPFKDIFAETRLLPLAFAHKRRMDKSQLAALLAEYGVKLPVETFEQHDIIFPFFGSWR
jgi:hypothetical protein